MTSRRLLVVLLPLLSPALACGDDAGVGGGSDAPPPPPDGPPMPPADAMPADAWVPPFTLADGCPDLFDQALLPTFFVEIDAAEWRKLERDWAAGYSKYLSGDYTNLHPERELVSFRFRREIVESASIRVRGNPHWWVAGGKMQFEISFNTVDRDGRFHSLRHIVLDAPGGNKSFLRERLALSFLRDLDLPAPCANNARLVVNGVYYGLFTHLQKVDKSFLKRNFANPDGNLYKRKRWKLKTNEEVGDTSALDALLETRDIETLATRMDLDEAVLEWAAEAAIPNGDGAWQGGQNYYLYDDPTRGFVYIPWDFDGTYDRWPADTDPLRFKRPPPWGQRPFWDLVIDDAAWFDKWLAALTRARDAYVPAVLQARLEEWSVQIADAAAADPNKQFTTEEYLQAVDDLRAYVTARRAYVDEWLADPPSP